jgi:hypothetical protein
MDLDLAVHRRRRVASLGGQRQGDPGRPQARVLPRVSAIGIERLKALARPPKAPRQVLRHDGPAHGPGAPSAERIRRMRWVPVPRLGRRCAPAGQKEILPERAVQGGGRLGGVARSAEDGEARG